MWFMFDDNNHQFFIINMYTKSGYGPRIRGAYGNSKKSITRSAFNRRVSWFLLWDYFFFFELSVLFVMWKNKSNTALNYGRLHGSLNILSYSCMYITQAHSICVHSEWVTVCINVYFYPTLTCVAAWKRNRKAAAEANKIIFICCWLLYIVTWIKKNKSL